MAVPTRQNQQAGGQQLIEETQLTQQTVALLQPREQLQPNGSIGPPLFAPKSI
jgi:hypothetical protein